jgi:nucleoside-diphosphate-sugar epimerase
VSKILITGGAGFIGYHLATELASKGHYVHIVDNFARGVRDPELERLIENDNVVFDQVDLLSDDLTAKFSDDYDYIYHLAAIIGVRIVLSKPYSVLNDNVKLTAKLLEVAEAQNNLKRFLFASTSEVYAGTLKYFDLPVPTPETTPLAVTNLTEPRTTYMLSKIYGEAMCNHSKVPTTNFRPHNVYGPRMGMAHVVPELLKKGYDLNDGDELEVFSVDHKRTFCYVSDAVQMLIRMAESENCLNETLNLGISAPEITIGKLADTVIETLGKKLNKKPLPAHEGSPSRRCPDMDKLEKLTGYRAVVTPEEGVRKTYEWYRKNVFEGGVVSADQ